MHALAAEQLSSPASVISLDATGLCEGLETYVLSISGILHAQKSILLLKFHLSLMLDAAHFSRIWHDPALLGGLVVFSHCAQSRCRKVSIYN